MLILEDVSNTSLPSCIWVGMEARKQHAVSLVCSLLASSDARLVIYSIREGRDRNSEWETISLMREASGTRDFALALVKDDTIYHPEEASALYSTRQAFNFHCPS